MDCVTIVSEIHNRKVSIPLEDFQLGGMLHHPDTNHDIVFVYNHVFIGISFLLVKTFYGSYHHVK